MMEESLATSCSPSGYSKCWPCLAAVPFPQKDPTSCFQLFSSLVLQFPFTLLPCFEQFQLLHFSKNTSPLPPLQYNSEEEEEFFFLRGLQSQVVLETPFPFSILLLCCFVPLSCSP